MYTATEEKVRKLETGHAQLSARHGMTEVGTISLMTMFTSKLGHGTYHMYSFVIVAAHYKTTELHTAGSGLLMLVQYTCTRLVCTYTYMYMNIFDPYSAQDEGLRTLSG